MNREWLTEQYQTNKLSLAAIAKVAGCSAPTVQNHLRKFGIPTRSISQALSGRKLSAEHKAKIMPNVIKANTARHLNGVSPEEKNRLASIRFNRTGMAHTEETKVQISKAHLGKVMSDEACKKMSEARQGKFAGKNHPMYGHSREDIKGEKNHNWRGGIASIYRKFRKTTKYIEWRTACYERDNYICQICNKRGNGDLNVDHIKPFAVILSENKITNIEQLYACHEVWNLENGRTLCISCHEKTPTFGGGTLRLLKTLSA